MPGWMGVSASGLILPFLFCFVLLSFGAAGDRPPLPLSSTAFSTPPPQIREHSSPSHSFKMVVVAQLCSARLACASKVPVSSRPSRLSSRRIAPRAEGGSPAEETKITKVTRAKHGAGGAAGGGWSYVRSALRLQANREGDELWFATDRSLAYLDGTLAGVRETGFCLRWLESKSRSIDRLIDSRTLSFSCAHAHAGLWLRPPRPVRSRGRRRGHVSHLAGVR